MTLSPAPLNLLLIRMLALNTGKLNGLKQLTVRKQAPCSGGTDGTGKRSAKQC
jgi:hypothetical protein